MNQVSQVNQDAQSSTSSLILDPSAMQSMVAFAEFMCKSNITIPKHLQGNSGDCLAVTMQAMQWGMNPYSVAQKTHIVNGNLGYEAQLVNAVIITKAPIVSRPDYNWYGDWSKVDGKTCKASDIGVRVSVTLKGESSARILDVSFSQVGNVRNSPNWVNDPKQQIAYLAIKKMSRLHFPDVILGVYTDDELMDNSAEIDVTPSDSAVDFKSMDNRPTLTDSQIEKAIVKIKSGEGSLSGLESAYNLTDEQYSHVQHQIGIIEHDSV